MKRIYVGPFSRFAFEEHKGVFTVFDAEAGTPAPAVEAFATKQEALNYIKQCIAADPTMKEDAE